MTKVLKSLVTIFIFHVFLLQITYSKKIIDNHVRKVNNNHPKANEKSKDVEDRRLDNPLQGFGSTPTNRYPLGVCQGDCDSDSQCQSGLYCFQKNKNEPVPGCYENSQGDFGAQTDYCIYKNNGGGGGNNNGGNNNGGNNNGGGDSSSSSSSSSSSTTTINYYSEAMEGGGLGGFGDFLECFSSNNYITILDGTTKRMDKIQIGDMVLTGNGEYETIYTIDHMDITKDTKFVQIYYNNNYPPLELTPKHMLYIQGKESPIASKNVQIGDIIQTINGPKKIIKLDYIYRTGVYNPLTKSGTIVVNGIISSTYSDYFDNNIISSNHNFFNTILKPYQLLSTIINFNGITNNNKKIMISRIGSNIYNYWYKIENETIKYIYLTLCIIIVSVINYIFNPYFVIMTTIGYMYVNKKQNKKILKTQTQ